MWFVSVLEVQKASGSNNLEIRSCAIVEAFHGMQFKDFLFLHYNAG